MQTEFDQGQENEWIFAQAREHALLTKAQEIDLDRRKWSAIRGLQRLLVAVPAGQRYLRLWAENLLLNRPRIEDYDSRDDFFLLRRELTAYLDEGPARAAVEEVHASRLEEGDDESAWETLIQPLDLPAALTAGMVSQLPGVDRESALVRALRQWQVSWAEAPILPGASLAKEECLSARRLLSRYERARDELVCCNLRLVFKVAAQHRGRGVPTSDLIQEGTLGLLRAAEKYDAARGYRFSTYAFNWIQQAVRRAIEDGAGAVRHPAAVREQIGRIVSERQRCLSMGQPEPTDVGLSTALKMPLEKVRLLRQQGNLQLSTEQPLAGNGEGAPLGEQLPGGPFNGPEEVADSVLLKRNLRVALDTLNASEREIVCARWGLEGHREVSRAQLALQMGTSREWIRQLEGRALAKLAQNPGIQQLLDHRQSG